MKNIKTWLFVAALVAAMSVPNLIAPDPAFPEDQIEVDK